MNAADQRRLTPWLIALCLVLAALWLIFLAGVGRGIHWAPSAASRSLPTAQQSVSTGAPVPLKRDAEIWQRPLFTADRQPMPVASGNGEQTTSLKHLQLTGVILAPGMHMALLTDRGDGHTVRVLEGQHLAHSSWMLKTLKPRSAEFAGDGQVTRLQLKVTPDQDDAVSAATAPHPVRFLRPDNKPPASGRTPVREKPDADNKQRIKVIKARVEQRRRQQAAHAGDH